jgi:tetratricopeptide (TPR) repeat protein
VISCFILLLVLQSAGSPQRPAARDPAAVASFRAGLEAQQRGELAAAEAAYRRALELDPRYVDALVNLGAVLSRGGRHEESVRCYERALQIDPKMNAARLNLGLAHYRAGKLSSAADALRAAYEYDPSLLQVRQLLGLVLGEMSKDADAIPHLEVSLQAAPNEPAVLFALGRAYARTGDARANAIAARLEQTPDGKALWQQLQGLVLQQAGRHDQALTAFEAAFALNASLPRLSTNIGFSRLALGDHMGARRAFESALLLNEGDAAANLYLAWLDEQDDRLPDALRHAERAVAIDADLPGARGLLGRILLKQGSPAIALDHLQHAAAAEPRDASWHFLLAQAYRRLGKAADASREFTEATRLKAVEVVQDRGKTNVR